MADFLALLLSAALIDNLALQYLFGLSPMMTVAGRLRVAAALSLAMLPLTPACAAATFALERAARALPELRDFRPLLLVLCVFALIQLADRPARRLLPRLAPELQGGGLRLKGLLATNSLLLAAALLSLDVAGLSAPFSTGFAAAPSAAPAAPAAGFIAGLAAALVFGIGAALGFSFVLFAFTAVDARLQASALPAAVKGLSIQLITLGIVSMSFLGFAGLARLG